MQQHKKLAVLGAAFLVTVCMQDTATADSRLSSTAEDQSAKNWDESDSLFDGTINTMVVYVDHKTFEKVTAPQSRRFKTEDGGTTNGDACKDDARYGKIEKIEFFNEKIREKKTLMGGGFRVKGNTSCSNYDKQFVVKLTATKTFERYGTVSQYSKSDAKRIKDNKLFGIKQFALRDSQNDPAKLRETLASRTFAFGGELARAFGIRGAPRFGGAVYRAGFVHVKFRFTGNDQARNNFDKIYVMTELVDKTFLGMRYGKKAIGHLYKTSHNRDGAALLMKSFSSKHKSERANKVMSRKLASIYSRDDKLNSIYKPKIINGTDADGQERESAMIMRQFIDKIEAATTKDDLIRFIDIGNFLSYLASVNLTGHWDSLVTNGNNDYLFFNTSFKDGTVFGSKGLRGKWQIIAWDLDNTFGSLATNGGAHDAVWYGGIYQFNKGRSISHGDRALFAKILWLWGDAYRERIGHFIHGYNDPRRGWQVGVFDKTRVNNRIIAVRDSLLKARGDDGRIDDGSNLFDEKFELLFRWKNQRWDIANSDIN